MQHARIEPSDIHPIDGHVERRPVPALHHRHHLREMMAHVIILTEGIGTVQGSQENNRRDERVESQRGGKHPAVNRTSEKHDPAACIPARSPASTEHAEAQRKRCQGYNRNGQDHRKPIGMEADTIEHNP